MRMQLTELKIHMSTGRGRSAKVVQGQAQGQAMVEFALIGGLVILLLFGIIEVGRLMFMNAEVQNAASEAANYASLNPPPCSNPGPTYQATVIAVAKSKLVMVDRSTLQVSDATTGTCAFCPVQITVTSTWNTFLPVIGGGQFVKSSRKLVEYIPTPCP